MIVIYLVFIIVLFLPSIAGAWGPLTHLYLGSQVIDLGAGVIPAGIYMLLKRFRKDFLYGNLSADVILGRRFQEYKKNSHNWSIGWRLLESAKTQRQKAFAYGYLTHLSADTVAHNQRSATIPFGHSLLEMKSDSMIDRNHRKTLKSIDRVIQKRNDILLENVLESVVFSFKTNKRIFKGVLLLSRLPNYRPVSNFFHNRLNYEISLVDIQNFHQESIEKMLDILINGEDSDVLKEEPLGRHLYNGISHNQVAR
ncbi:MAG: zinc dependent phospholipase C family protein [Thermodesulfovibrionia bacterium]